MKCKTGGGAGPVQMSAGWSYQDFKIQLQMESSVSLTRTCRDKANEKLQV